MNEQAIRQELAEILTKWARISALIKDTAEKYKTFYSEYTQPDAHRDVSWGFYKVEEPALEDIDIDSGTITLRFIDDWSGGPDREERYVPLSYLWDDGWEAREREWLENAKREREKQRLAYLRAVEERNERRERETYEYLKAKFEKGANP
jgi:hypothetical protein